MRHPGGGQTVAVGDHGAAFFAWNRSLPSEYWVHPLIALVPMFLAFWRNGGNGVRRILLLFIDFVTGWPVLIHRANNRGNRPFHPARGSAARFPPPRHREASH